MIANTFYFHKNIINNLEKHNMVENASLFFKILP